MAKTLCLLIFSFLWLNAPLAQQLYLEGFAGLNRSNFDIPPFEQSPKWFSPIGGRLAFGADHVQIGGEYHQTLTNPTWTEDAILASGETKFETTYYGGFLRAKISRYPAMRFGLVLRAGAGMYNTARVSTVPNLAKNVDYKQKLGFNGGIGVSVPLFHPVMLELGYTYYYVDYDAIENTIAAMNGSYHSLQAGLSFNFVFGKRADDYRHLKENWKFRKGWRG